ncbi:MAG: ArnT family glycosyltransferase [Thermoguttaceae bacterium]
MNFSSARMAISPSRPRIVDLVAWTLLAIALIFAVYVRARLREFPLERDEGEFAYAGQLLLQGVPPYKLAYNMKLPGTYLAYAALMAVFGQTTAGIHLGLLAVNLATIVLLYRFVRELFDPFSAGMAAVAYSILSVSPAMLAMAAHATHFVAFFGLAGTYLLWRHLQSGRWWQAFASGLLMGIAFLMKQQGVFLMVFGGGLLLLLGLRLATYPRKRLPAALGLYSLAAVLPYALICFWLWQAGVWDKFWFWTVEYASKYVQNIPLSLAGAVFWQNSSGIVQPNWPLGLLALAGIAGVAILGRGKPGLRSFVFGFVVFSFFCVCPGFYFRQHYFIALLPAVAMLVGVGCRLLWDLASGGFWTGGAATSATAEQRAPARAARQKRGHSNPFKPEPRPVVAGGFGPLPALAALLLLAAVGWTVWMQSTFFFTLAPLDACRLIYMSNPFQECPTIAEYLKARTEPGDTIAVLGSEPEIFFNSQRRSATGYIYTYGLVELQPLASKMQEEMIAEIEAAKPKYVVFANVYCSWLTQPTSETEILQWAGDYLDKNYRIVGIFEPRSDMETACFWDDQIAKYRPPTQPTNLDIYWKLRPFPGVPIVQKYCRLPYIMVFRRKS